MRLGTAFSTPSWFTASTNWGGCEGGGCTGGWVELRSGKARGLGARPPAAAPPGALPAGHHRRRSAAAQQAQAQARTCWCISTDHTTRGFLLAPCVSCCTCSVSLSLRFTPWWCCSRGGRGRRTARWAAARRGTQSARCAACPAPPRVPRTCSPSRPECSSEARGWCSERRRTTCCHTLRSSSTRTGLIRKSTAPCVTPRSTTFVSPLEDITAGGQGQESARSGRAARGQEMPAAAPRQQMWALPGGALPAAAAPLTDDGQLQLESNVLQQLEAVHVCRRQGSGPGARALAPRAAPSCSCRPAAAARAAVPARFQPRAGTPAHAPGMYTSESTRSNWWLCSCRSRSSCSASWPLDRVSTS